MLVAIKNYSTARFDFMVFSLSLSLRRHWNTKEMWININDFGKPKWNCSTNTTDFLIFAYKSQTPLIFFLSGTAQPIEIISILQIFDFRLSIWRFRYCSQSFNAFLDVCIFIEIILFVAVPIFSINLNWYKKLFSFRIKICIRQQKQQTPLFVRISLSF